VVVVVVSVLDDCCVSNMRAANKTLSCESKLSCHTLLITSLPRLLFFRQGLPPNSAFQCHASNPVLHKTTLLPAFCLSCGHSPSTTLHHCLARPMTQTATRQARRSINSISSHT
jgi:hypothetical protein